MGTNLSVHYGDEVNNEYETRDEALNVLIFTFVPSIITFLTWLFALYHIIISKHIKKHKSVQLYFYTFLFAISLNFLYCIRVFIFQAITILTNEYLACLDYRWLSGSSMDVSWRTTLFYLSWAKLLKVSSTRARSWP